MEPRHLSRNSRSNTTENCHRVIFPTYCIPSRYCANLTSEAKNELLYFGSETLSAALSKWQRKRKCCEPADPYLQGIMTREDVDVVIGCLQDLIPEAERKPIMPDLRPHDWFRPGDPIVSRLVSDVHNYYIVKHDYYINGWVQLSAEPRYIGTVTGASDGQVMLQLDGVPCSGHDLAYIDFCPFVLKDWEYDYFLKDIAFFKFWCRFSHKDSYADLEALILH